MKRERNKEKDLEGTKQGSVTRVLADEENFYYDKIDLFPYAQEGMTRGEWMCGLNRTLQVGERVFFLDHSYRVWNDRVNIHQLSSECGIFARGRLVAAEPKDQLRLLDREVYSDLSTAYCETVWCDEETFFVEYVFDSIVDLEYALPIVWLQQQPGCQGLFPEAPSSGDLIPAHLAASLNEYWENHVRKQEAEDLGLRLSQQEPRVRGEERLD